MHTLGVSQDITGKELLWPIYKLLNVHHKFMSLFRVNDTAHSAAMPQ
jgi:hypothetical protein